MIFKNKILKKLVSHELPSKKGTDSTTFSFNKYSICIFYKFRNYTSSRYHAGRLNLFCKNKNLFPVVKFIQPYLKDRQLLNSITPLRSFLYSYRHISYSNISLFLNGFKNIPLTQTQSIKNY